MNSCILEVIPLFSLDGGPFGNHVEIVGMEALVLEVYRGVKERLEVVGVPLLQDAHSLGPVANGVVPALPIMLAYTMQPRGLKEGNTFSGSLTEESISC